jgi:hypothetical protein
MKIALLYLVGRFDRSGRLGVKSENSGLGDGHEFLVAAHP